MVTDGLAQSADLFFKNFDMQNGLCDNHINSISEDSRGMIWIATREGLSRYDGAQFKNFYSDKKNKEALQGNYTTNLLPYNKDRLLLLNVDRAVVLNCITNQITPIKQLEKYHFSSIKQLNDKLYAFSTFTEVLLVDKHFNIVHKLSTPLLKAPIQVKWMGGDRYLLCDFTSFCIFNLKKKSYETINFAFHNSVKLGQDTYYNLQQLDRQGHRIYISDYWTGLYVFDFEGNLVHQYSKMNTRGAISSNTITHSLLTNDGKLWLTTDNGVNIIDLKEETVKQLFHIANDNFSISSNVSYTLSKTKNNGIWIGSDQGLSFYKNQTQSSVKKIVLPTPPGYALSVADIAIEGNLVFAGCYLSDTYKINNRSASIEKLKNTPAAWSVNNYDGKIMITGGSKTITTYNTKDNSYQSLAFLEAYFPTSDIIVMSFRHSNGDYWYSGNAGGGLVRVDAKTKKIEHYPYIVNGKRSFYSSYYPYVAEDSGGDLWFGVNKASALLHWIKKENKFEEIPFSVFLKDAPKNPGGINQLLCDKHNHLWVGYDGNGLACYNTKTKISKVFTTEDGLSSNYINALEIDTKGRLWMVTAKGLNCFIPNQKKIVQLNIWDGFVDNPLNYSVLKLDTIQNTMYLGGTNAVYYFNPDVILAHKTTQSSLFMDCIKINNIAYKNVATSLISLPPDNNTIEFSMVAVDIENGKNIEYSYKLDGANEQWTSLGINRSVLFPKLKSGTYSFNGRARYQGSKEWFYIHKPLVLKIATHWYKTWWFLALLFFFFILLVVYAVYYNFKKQLEKQRAVEAERNRIAADMHDDLGSGLTKITYLSQMALQHTDQKDYLSIIKATSTELVESMSEIIWAMKEENNRWDELISYIKLYAQEYGQNNNLGVHFKYPEADMEFTIIGEVRRHIFLSIKEVLHNIVKHANAKNITIQIEKKSAVVITIKDDGQGFTERPEGYLGGNGLKNIEQRMQKIGGQMTITQDQGTQITFTIPY
jgi:ligand-binding sensor domain-containing protein/two-component sensor histidine kinase